MSSKTKAEVRAKNPTVITPLFRRLLEKYGSKATIYSNRLKGGKFRVKLYCVDIDQEQKAAFISEVEETANKIGCCLLRFEKGRFYGDTYHMHFKNAEWFIANTVQMRFIPQDDLFSPKLVQNGEFGKLSRPMSETEAKHVVHDIGFPIEVASKIATESNELKRQLRLLAYEAQHYISTKANGLQLNHAIKRALEL